MQGSLHAANTIVRRLRGETEAKPYKYRDLGSVAAIGRFRAICSVGRLRLSGFAGWVVWMFVHLAFLNGWGNRFTTMMRWLRWLVGRNRVERVFSVAPHRRRPQRTCCRAACPRAKPLPGHDRRQGGRRHGSVTFALLL